jgi:hypothetical protein
MDGIVVLNPGVKVAYTFGDGGGMTYGGELTALFSTGPNLHAIVAAGPDLNLGWTSGGVFEGRIGVDLVSWFAGLEAGPALVSDGAGSHFGFGLTGWLSALFVDPYFTYTWVGGRDDTSELGAYFKLPICLGSNCAYGATGWHNHSHH